jgi:hypothetical protein
MIRNENAQLYTMEAIISSMLLVLVVIFILKATPLTSTLSSAAHQQIETQLDVMGHDLMTVLDYTPEGSQYSALKKAIINWDGTEYSGQSPVRPYGGDLNATAANLSDTLGSKGIAYNLEVNYITPSGTGSRPILWNGKPSENAVTVSKKITIYDEDMVTNPLSDIIPDIDSNRTRYYNTIDVRLTLWQI